MQSSQFRFLLALSVLLACWTVTNLSIHDAHAGGDDDDTEGDDDSAGDDDASDDDDSSDDGGGLGGPEVPFEDRELGGGCACSSQGSSVAVGLGPTLLLLGGLVLRRRRHPLGA